MISARLLTILITLVHAGHLAADEPRTFVIAGSMVDVISGRVLSDQVITIEGDRIAAVGPAGSTVIPRGADVIDLGEATVLPGLIDMHVHLTGDQKAHGYKNLAASTPRNALHGATNAGRTIAAGFTTVRNVGAGGYVDIALRDAINDGDIVGPRMLVSGPALGITGGHCDNNLLPPRYEERSQGVADSPWAVRAKVRENIKYGSDIIKFCATGGVMSKGTSVGAQQYTLEEMFAIVEEAHRRDRNVAAHAHGTEGIKAAITAGVDSVEHASMIDDEGIRMARDAGTFLVMDIYVDTYILEMGETAGILPESLEKERIVGQLQRDNFRKAHKAGVKLAFGSDAGIYPHGDNAKQFSYMVEYGMSPMESIQAATINAAELIGWSGDVGAIRPGGYADIIAVRGNPLEDIRVLEDVRFVMKGGEIYKQL
ncbi:MAG: amidohydrolase family protein [Woeseia sp.]